MRPPLRSISQVALPFNRTRKARNAAAITVMVAGFVSIIWYKCMLLRKNGRTSLVSKHITRKNYISRIIYESDVACLAMMRMKREVFFNLCNTLQNRGLLWDTFHITVEEQVAMFMHTIGHNVRNRVIGINFLRSGETVSLYFNHVLHAIGELRSELITPPTNTPHTVISMSTRYMPYFKDCIGALDGTHIHATVPAAIAGQFRGRKPYTTQNVLASIGFDLKFTYVLGGWEGSAHDALVLKDALEKEDGLKVKQGKYYLVDAGYSTKSGFIAPYRGVRYHLKEYTDRAPTNAKELFNHRHSSLRTSIERAFGALKNRFKILASKPFHPFASQVDIVLGCCILHNFTIDNGGDNYIPIEAQWVSRRCWRSRREERDDAREWLLLRDCMAADMWANR